MLVFITYRSQKPKIPFHSEKPSLVSSQRAENQIVSSLHLKNISAKNVQFESFWAMCFDFTDFSDKMWFFCNIYPTIVAPPPHNPEGRFATIWKNCYTPCFQAEWLAVQEAVLYLTCKQSLIQAVLPFVEDIMPHFNFQTFHIKYLHNDEIVRVSLIRLYVVILA